jgi:hypothetical protein
MEIALVGAAVIFHGAIEIDQIKSREIARAALLSRADEFFVLRPTRQTTSPQLS